MASILPDALRVTALTHHRSLYRMSMAGLTACATERPPRTSALAAPSSKRPPFDWKASTTIPLLHASKGKLCFLDWEGVSSLELELIARCGLMGWAPH